MEKGSLMFSLDRRLAVDTVEAATLELSLVLLMKDLTVPWLILVPRRDGMKEVCDLAPCDRAALMEEAALASRVIKSLYRIDKINIGSLGNIVPQLHLHVIGRYATDRAWPGPIWGVSGQGASPAEEISVEVNRIKAAFKDLSQNKTI